MINQNLLEIRKRILAACSRAKTDPGLVTLVAVSKGRTSEQIRQAIEAGITDIGENRVQEASLKYKQFSPVNRGPSVIRWHMVGHLQTNKAKDAVAIFDLIQSVDSMRLASEIDRQAARINKIQDILLEVKTSPEAAKFGIKPEDAVEVLKKISALKNTSVKGLMTVAPITDKPEEARLYFRMLRELRDKIYELRVAGCELRILSMGMTDDFEVAIEEGSTMVRLGRAIFD